MSSKLRKNTRISLGEPYGAHASVSHELQLLSPSQQEGQQHAQKEHTQQQQATVDGHLQVCQRQQQEVVEVEEKRKEEAEEQTEEEKGLSEWRTTLHNTATRCNTLAAVLHGGVPPATRKVGGGVGGDSGSGHRGKRLRSAAYLLANLKHTLERKSRRTSLHVKHAHKKDVRPLLYPRIVRTFPVLLPQHHVVLPTITSCNVGGDEGGGGGEGGRGQWLADRGKGFGVPLPLAHSNFSFQRSSSFASSSSLQPRRDEARARESESGTKRVRATAREGDRDWNHTTNQGGEKERKKVNDRSPSIAGCNANVKDANVKDANATDGFLATMQQQYVAAAALLSVFSHSHARI